MIKDSRTTTVDALLSGSKVYKVPLYQRSFSWEREQVERFLDDILDMVEEKRKDYFLGAVILKEISENEAEIIDGQQRLAIITMLFACLRDLYYEWGNVQIATGIQSEFLGRRSYTSAEREYKLHLNKYDETYFRQYIQEFNASGKNPRFGRKMGIPYSHKLIRNAYYILFDKLKDKVEALKPQGTQEEFLQTLEKCVATKLKFIITQVDDEADAWVIFETLNDRGLDLTIADLLKNYLYSKAGRNINIIQNIWDNIVTTLEGQNLNSFLRHYWSSSEALVREKDLYKELRAQLKKEKDIYDFVTVLKSEAEVYQALISPEDDAYWEDRETQLALQELKIMGAKLIFPLLLSAKSKFSSSDFRKLVRLGVNLTFRYSVIVNENPNKLERKYSELAIGTRKGKWTFEQLRIQLLSLNPNSDRFVEAFSIREIKNSELARYILAKINNRIMNKEEIGTIEDSTKVNLEHIIPKTLDGQWREYLKKHKIEHREVVHRLGNLTLLAKQKNSRAGNKAFEIKKAEIYSKSELQITSSLKKYKQWDLAGIEDRQRELGKTANEIW